MKRTQIYLSEEQHELLRRVAFEQRKSISQVIRDMVDQASQKSKNLGKSAVSSVLQGSTQANGPKTQATDKEFKERIDKVLETEKIEEAAKVTESLKDIVSEERYNQLTTALKEYRKSLEKFSKYS